VTDVDMPALLRGGTWRVPAHLISVNRQGCNSQHKVGDKFYMDGVGNLISKLCPKRMCLYAVSALRPIVFAANELLYAGVDPGQIRFNRCGCADVGLECGGWGKIVMEVKVVDRGTP